MLKNNKLNFIFNLVDNSTLISLIIISTVSSILFLVIPVTAQALVNFIAFGHLMRPVLILSMIVFVLVIGGGLLNLWHNILIEIIQQKIIVNFSIKLTKQVISLSHRSLIAHDNPKEVNKFFDMVVVIKSLGGILSYGINLILQIFFGLIVLLIYHPYFIIFDFFILVFLLIIFLSPYRIAKTTAYHECLEKHGIADWLDEIVLNRYLFKFFNLSNFAIKEADKRLVNFLKYRNKHFRQLIKYQIGLFVLAAVVISVLLCLGGYLVINSQLSLGQLVAAEIIIGIIVYALNQFIKVLEDYFDLRASLDIFESLFHLPREFTDSVSDDKMRKIDNLIEVNLVLTCDDKKFIANFEKPLLIKSPDRKFIEDILMHLIGMTTNKSLEIMLNGIVCKQDVLIGLRRQTMMLQEPQWISGTIYDNIVLGAAKISMDYISEYLDKLGLRDKISTFADGLLTYVSSWQYDFTEKEAVLLMILRVIINAPKIVIIDRTLDLLDKNTAEKVLELLFSLPNRTYIITTQHHDFSIISNCWEI